jgi:hypothetical protein
MYDDFDTAGRAGGSARKAGDNAKPYEPKPNGNGEGAGDQFKLMRLADVAPEAIRWLWDGRLAIGKLTLLGGDPEQGKSLITTDAAARISKGLHWPNGARAPIGSTIFLASEDGVADTVRPRAEAAGADLTKLLVFESTFLKDGARKTFSLQSDLDILGAAIRQVGDARLVIIDAITSYMGKVDSHRTTDVRAVLEPVASFAEQNNVSILGVTHPPKASQGNALRSFTGSFAFIATARIGLFVTSEPETDRRLLLSVKTNIGPKARGIGYFIGTKTITNRIIAPHVLWSDAPVDYTADQALAANAAAMKEHRSDLNEAKEFLRELLKDGPVGAADGKEAAEAEGISERTLARAKKALGVKSEKGEFRGGWQWARS